MKTKRLRSNNRKNKTKLVHFILENWDQKTFIVNSVEKKNAVKHRKTQNEESRQDASLRYYFTIDGVRTQVSV